LGPRRCIVESLGMWRRLGNKRSVPVQIVALAAVAVSGGHAEEAARLVGAAEKLLEDVKGTFVFCDRDEHARTVAEVEAMLRSPPLVLRAAR
jgi:hypothetical protein